MARKNDSKEAEKTSFGGDQMLTSSATGEVSDLPAIEHGQLI